MNKYTNFIFSKKGTLAIIIGIITIISIIGLFKIKLNTSFSVFSKNDSVYEERLANLETIFGELNQIVVVVKTDTFDETVISNLHSIQTQISNGTHIDSVQGVAPDTIIINSVPTNILSVEPNQLLTYYENFQEFSPIVIENGSYYSIFNVFIDDDYSKSDITDLEDILNSYNYNSYISGDSYNQMKISDYIFKILLILPPLAFLVIFLVFKWQMKNVKATIFSILPASIGSIWTMGLIGWLGNEVSLLTAIVPIFIIVIGSADGLHFMSHFQDSKSLGDSNKEALTKTLTIVGIPMIITTLTSMVGFLSLLSMKTDSVWDLAIFSAVGIFLAGIATWLIIPLILTKDINILPKKKHKKRIDLSIYLRKLWGYPIIGITILLIAFSIIFLPKINHEFNMLMIYKDYTEVVKNSEKIKEINGGSIPIYVTIKFDSSPLTIESLNEINYLADTLNSIEETNKIINPYRLMELIYNMNTDGSIPNNTVLSSIYNNIIIDESNIINDLISVDNKTVRLLIFPKDLNNATLGKIEETVSNTDPNANVTGVEYLMRDLNVNISSMQIYSIIIALSIIFLMMFVTLKNIKIAFTSLIPILITVFTLYGFLGISQISLNITTVIIFSITIGVGIDYAIHFSSVYQYFLKKGFSNNEAVGKAYTNSSRPIITNALGISLGLTIMMLSPLNIHTNVSLLMWVSMTVSVIVTLSLLPTIFRTKNYN